MIAGISATIAGLRGANLGAAAVLLAGSATATLPTATVLALPTATAAVSLTGTAPAAPAATMLPAAAVTVGRALPLGCTFHGVDERGCKYHSRRNKQ